MLRMRGFRLLAVMTFTLALATTGFAWPPGGNGGGGGGNGGGGGGGEDPPAPPQYYDITIVAPFNYTSTDFYGMNEHGDLVGRFWNSASDQFAFLYTQEFGLVDLNSLLPADSDWWLRTADAINNQGVMVGLGRLPGDTTSRTVRMTLAEDGTLNIEDLGKFHPDDYAPPSGINDSGEIVGRYDPIGSGGDLFVYYFTDAIGFVEIDLGVTGNFSTPVGINNQGQVFGNLYGDAYRVIPGSAPEWFVSPASGYTLYNYGFNDFGEFCGRALFPGKGNKVYDAAYRHDGTNFFEIVKDADAFDVNNAGDVAGLLSSGESYVYLEALDALVMLDDAVVGTQSELDFWFAGDTRADPFFINDDGVISGIIRWTGGPNPLFILTPVPAP